MQGDGLDRGGREVLLRGGGGSWRARGVHCHLIYSTCDAGSHNYDSLLFYTQTHTHIYTLHADDDD